MSYALYILGFLIVAAGLALGAHYMHVPPHWIAVGLLVIIGMGVASGVAKTRHRDPS